MADGLEGQTLIVEAAQALPAAGAIGELVLSSEQAGVLRTADTSLAVRILGHGTGHLGARRPRKVVITAIGPTTDGVTRAELTVLQDDGGEGGND